MSKVEKFFFGIACALFGLCAGCTNITGPNPPTSIADAHPWQVP